MPNTINDVFKDVSLGAARITALAVNKNAPAAFDRMAPGAKALLVRSVAQTLDQSMKDIGFRPQDDWHMAALDFALQGHDQIADAFVQQIARWEKLAVNILRAACE